MSYSYFDNNTTRLALYGLPLCLVGRPLLILVMMCSHVAMLCKTAPGSQKSAVVFAFLCATGALLHSMQVPLCMYVCMNFVPSCALTELSNDITAYIAPCTVVNKSYSPFSQAWNSMSCAGMHAEDELNNIVPCTIIPCITHATWMWLWWLVHRTAGGCNRGWAQGTGEDDDRGRCSWAVSNTWHSHSWDCTTFLKVVNLSLITSSQ